MPSGLRVVRELAQGGMGRVELVVRREGSFGRAYACKRLLPGIAEDAAARAMFLEEGRIAGLVRNAHVVPVVDAGEDDEGPYLLMELVDGVSLAELITRVGSRLPAQIAIEIARQIAEGLHAAHELRSPRGAMELVHRDLSPDNVLVGFDGIARVTDFGVARARDRAATTRVGAVIGKRSYMPPEQLRGEPIDRRADLFALGVVLAELLRGGPLHGDASPAEIARRTLEEPPPDPGDDRDDVPPELVALVFELMAKRADDRPRDARTVAARLARIGAALRAEEGPLDLGELVRGTFEDRRRARQREIEEALREESAGDAPARAEPAAEAGDARGAGRGRASSWTGVIGAVAGIAALVIAGIALHAVMAQREMGTGTGSATEPEPEPGTGGVAETEDVAPMGADDVGGGQAEIERGAIGSGGASTSATGAAADEGQADEGQADEAHADEGQADEDATEPEEVGGEAGRGSDAARRRARARRARQEGPPTWSW